MPFGSFRDYACTTGRDFRWRVWDGLGPPELAACVSALVFESRQPEDAATPRLPPGRSREALAETVRIWAALEERESDHRIDRAREPDLGFVWPTFRWASGDPLDAVLRDTELQAGDFVRWTKQVVDLLGQVSDATRLDDDAATAVGVSTIGSSEAVMLAGLALTVLGVTGTYVWLLVSLNNRVAALLGALSLVTIDRLRLQMH